MTAVQARLSLSHCNTSEVFCNTENGRLAFETCPLPYQRHEGEIDLWPYATACDLKRDETASWVCRSYQFWPVGHAFGLWTFHADIHKPLACSE